MSITSFNLDGFSQPVPVDLTENITKEQLLNHQPFLDWKETLKTSLASQDKTTYTLRSIKIQSVDWFGKRIGFVKLLADVRNEQNEDDFLPGIVFLRGGSVAILMILRPRGAEHERLVVMVEQPRVPVATLSFLEIPAGMLDGNGDFKGVAAEEIEQETGIKVLKNELENMTALALEKSGISSDLQLAMYPSPGGSDEFITLYKWEKVVDQKEIEDLKEKLTGKRDEGEKITVKIVDYENLWKEGARDGKTLGAWALYQQLFYP
jgi:ADP-sugar diphosphatase